MAKLSREVANLLDRIVEHPIVSRKKAKFELQELVFKTEIIHENA